MLVIALVTDGSGSGVLPFSSALARIVLLAIIALFFVASRDALRKFYSRTDAILESRLSQEPKPMTNGWPRKSLSPQPAPEDRSQAIRSTSPDSSDKPADSNTSELDVENRQDAEKDQTD